MFIFFFFAVFTQLVFVHAEYHFYKVQQVPKIPWMGMSQGILSCSY